MEECEKPTEVSHLHKSNLIYVLIKIITIFASDIEFIFISKIFKITIFIYKDCGIQHYLTIFVIILLNNFK